MKIAIAINIDGQSRLYLLHSPNHLYDLSGIAYPHLLILKLIDFKSWRHGDRSDKIKSFGYLTDQSPPKNLSLNLFEAMDMDIMKTSSTILTLRLERVR